MALCNALTAIGKTLTGSCMSNDVSARLLFGQGYDLAFKRYMQDP